MIEKLTAQQKKQIEAIGTEFIDLDARRLEIERQARVLNKEAKKLKERIQDIVGKSGAPYDVADVLDTGKMIITQITRHRATYTVEAYDFTDFSIVKK